MPEVHSVCATVRLPINGDAGQITVGYYTLADGLLTMTDSKGAVVRVMHTGEKYSQKIKPGDDAKAIATRLTLKIRRAISGQSDFNRRLDYPRGGIV